MKDGFARGYAYGDEQQRGVQGIAKIMVDYDILFHGVVFLKEWIGCFHYTNGCALSLKSGWWYLQRR